MTPLFLSLPNTCGVITNRNVGLLGLVVSFFTGTRTLG
jgi:hypothetical protein